MADTAPTLLTILPFLLGGVGLFLVGMILMSDGLRAAAGSALQRILERSTGTRLSAFFTGVGLTALVQSSSATTVTTIGFVSAGLLSFPAAIGVIIGANVGTTSTGWIVSLLGFKLNVAALALPLVGVGALLRLLTSGRRAHLGMALAGFGLIFIGIDFLQQGMGGLAQRIDLSAYSDDALAGRLALTLIGAVMTVLLQSSSAAVALTLTALHSGAIALDQSAFLVIGQNLGTTITAVLASVGASVPARRTALAHILFNLVTGALAFVAADRLLEIVAVLGRALGNGGPAVGIALFHTVFNLIGAVLFLPVLGLFAGLINRLVPDRGPALTRHLDRSLLQIPAVAVEAAARALAAIGALTLSEAVDLLVTGLVSRSAREKLWTARVALTETGAFLGQLQIASYNREVYSRRLALLHAGDHLARLVEAGLRFEKPVQGAEVQAAATRLASELEAAAAWLGRPEGNAAELVGRLARASAQQAETRRSHRAWMLERTAAGQVQPDEAQARLESMRWVDRVGYHTWRVILHLTASPVAEAPLRTDSFEETEGAAAETPPP